MIAVYVTGHGFGHSTRTAEVLRVVRSKAPGLSITVSTTALIRPTPKATTRTILHKPLGTIVTFIHIPPGSLDSRPRTPQCTLPPLETFG